MNDVQKIIIVYQFGSGYSGASVFWWLPVLRLLLLLFVVVVVVVAA